MEHRNRVKAGVCTVFIGLCCVLGGCSLSFCGLTVGGGEEMVFTCEEGLPQVTETMPESANGAPVSEDESAEADTAVDEAGKVDLNTAGMEELMTLQGIGESRAEAILKYRREKGAFAEIEDIMQVPGIKDGIFSKIKDQITVH